MGEVPGVHSDVNHQFNFAIYLIHELSYVPHQSGRWASGTLNLEQRPKLDASWRDIVKTFGRDLIL